MKKIFIIAFIVDVLIFGILIFKIWKTENHVANLYRKVSNLEVELEELKKQNFENEIDVSLEK